MHILSRKSNQAKGLADFGIAFLQDCSPHRAVYNRLKLFHTDSVLCGLSALALNTHAPTRLRQEALTYRQSHGAFCFGSDVPVPPEKAVLANCSAVREWNANGTVFGFNEALPGHDKGQYGHNDFYPVCVAASQHRGLSGEIALRGMLLLDQIRGRLCEVVPLRYKKVDHVLNGGIASVVAYGALVGASALQIQSALGILVSHYVPFRSIRHGAQLSQSKATAAAFISEMAVLAVHRAMRGFEGPKDVFRNPYGVFGLFGATSDDSQFDLNLSSGGLDFAVMNMHFKLGMYEHQSAGAIQAILTIIRDHPHILREPDNIYSIDILIYSQALDIIADKAKYDPQNRQSCEHSIIYIIASLIRKAAEMKDHLVLQSIEDLWNQLILNPYDYSEYEIFNSDTREIMKRIRVIPGGQEYDKNYPRGIPTSIRVEHKYGTCESGMVMYPMGHALDNGTDLMMMLIEKFYLFGSYALNSPVQCIERLQSLENFSEEDMIGVYNWPYIVNKYSY